jgi:predicted AlkP superfamily phosphohydrolase/phosphomutase
VVADHGHTLIHREVFPNAWLRDQGLLRFTAEKPRGPADIDPSSRVFALDPGRIYLHRKGRFPLGTVDDAEAPALLEQVARACSRCGTTVRGAGRRSSRAARVRARRALSRRLPRPRRPIS